MLCLNLTFSQAFCLVISNLKVELYQTLNILILIKDISGQAVARRHGSNIYDSVSFAEEIWVLEGVNFAFCYCSNDKCSLWSEVFL